MLALYNTGVISLVVCAPSAVLEDTNAFAYRRFPDCPAFPSLQVSALTCKLMA